MTNPTKFGYPYLESIKSWLPIVDELVIIDGGSTDGSIEEINKIGDSKIRIISDKDTKWEEDWFYSRMGINFNRGYHECKGDIVIKFDIDYVLHEDAYLKEGDKYNFKVQFKKATTDNNLIISFTRWNFVLIDRYFFKAEKTLAVNRDACRKRNIPVDYGLDFKKWGWGYAPIVRSGIENKINMGDLLRTKGNSISFGGIKVFNYGFCFSTIEQASWARQRHMIAESKQKDLNYSDIKDKNHYSVEYLREHKSIGIRDHIRSAKSYLDGTPMIRLKIEDHPKVMWDKIKNLTPEQQGYNFWGKYNKADYYGN